MHIHGLVGRAQTSKCASSNGTALKYVKTRAVANFSHPDAGTDYPIVAAEMSNQSYPHLVDAIYAEVRGSRSRASTKRLLQATDVPKGTTYRTEILSHTASIEDPLELAGRDMAADTDEAVRYLPPGYTDHWPRKISEADLPVNITGVRPHGHSLPFGTRCVGLRSARERRPSTSGCSSIMDGDMQLVAPASRPLTPSSQRAAPVQPCSTRTELYTTDPTTEADIDISRGSIGSWDGSSVNSPLLKHLPSKFMKKRSATASAAKFTRQRSEPQLRQKQQPGPPTKGYRSVSARTHRSRPIDDIDDTIHVPVQATPVDVQSATKELSTDDSTNHIFQRSTVSSDERCDPEVELNSATVDANSKQEIAAALNDEHLDKSNQVDSIVRMPDIVVTPKISSLSRCHQVPEHRYVMLAETAGVQPDPVCLTASLERDSFNKMQNRLILRETQRMYAESRQRNRRKLSKLDHRCSWMGLKSDSDCSTVSRAPERPTVSVTDPSVTDHSTAPYLSQFSVESDLSQLFSDTDPIEIPVFPSQSIPISQPRINLRQLYREQRGWSLEGRRRNGCASMAPSESASAADLDLNSLLDSRPIRFNYESRLALRHIKSVPNLRGSATGSVPQTTPPRPPKVLPHIEPLPIGSCSFSLHNQWSTSHCSSASDSLDNTCNPIATVVVHIPIASASLTSPTGKSGTFGAHIGMRYDGSTAENENLTQLPPFQLVSRLQQQQRTLPGFVARRVEGST
eukprot:GILJ01005269.1.p1 GENE.GILJ01005269.1~~GILJ01005269.1.p1  ORF type:complete len:740 (+),score=69.67 GILJ01005269.1:47-2266(+)